MAEDLTRYRDDPVGFVTDVLGDAGKPYSKQAEMLDSLVEHRRVSVVGANGSGKDWTAARAVLWWTETRPESKALVTGPTQRQVDEIVWQEMREAYAAAEECLSGTMLKSAYRIDEKRFALGFSTNRACNIQGFHSPELLVVVTEAHAMPQDQIDAIKRLHPTRLLLVGNAMSLDGEFFESHHSRRARYRRIRISAYDTPNFTGENGGLPARSRRRTPRSLPSTGRRTTPTTPPPSSPSSRTPRTIRSWAARPWRPPWSAARMIVIPSEAQRSRGISRVKAPLTTNAPREMFRLHST